MLKERIKEAQFLFPCTCVKKCKRSVEGKSTRVWLIFLCVEYKKKVLKERRIEAWSIFLCVRVCGI